MYDLNSAEGWFSANGLIVSNCQCYGEPATEGHSGRRLGVQNFFNNLSHSEQNRRFGSAGAQAIREGADINQVVNAQRGITTMGSWTDEEGFTHRGSLVRTDVGGREVVVTKTGTARNGSYYHYERQAAEERLGVRYAHSRSEVAQGLPSFRLRAPRLTPAEIYKMTEDREELIGLLRKFGYLH